MRNGNPYKNSPYLCLQVPADDDSLVAKGVMLHHLAYSPLHLLGVFQAGLGRHAECAVRAAVVPHLHCGTLTQWLVIIQEVPLTVICNNKLKTSAQVLMRGHYDSLTTINVSGKKICIWR